MKNTIMAIIIFVLLIGGGYMAAMYAKKRECDRFLAISCIAFAFFLVIMGLICVF